MTQEDFSVCGVCDGAGEVPHFHGGKRTCTYCKGKGNVVRPVRQVESILDEAKRLTTQDRHESYGDYKDEAVKLAQMWSVVTGCKIEPRHVPLMMIAMKTLRQANKYKRDNLVDIAGYASIAEGIE